MCAQLGLWISIYVPQTFWSVYTYEHAKTKPLTNHATPISVPEMIIVLSSQTDSDDPSQQRSFSLLLQGSTNILIFMYLGFGKST